MALLARVMGVVVKDLGKAANWGKLAYRIMLSVAFPIAFNRI